MKNGWNRNPTAKVDWKLEAHEERMKNWAEEDNQDDVEDEVSVFSFESALDEDDSHEEIEYMHHRINWLDSYREFRTLHPIKHLTYMLPDWGD